MKQTAPEVPAKIAIKNWNLGAGKDVLNGAH